MSFSSLYVGATGVIAHNDSMQVISNNLANVSTNGYKKADIQFGDLVSQQMASGGVQYESGSYGISQIGKGVAVSEIRAIFSEGGYETTDTATDLAIAGNGFFGIVDPSATGTAVRYTRAGAYRFDNQAYLVDAHGYRLQGYAIDRDTGDVATSVSDIQLPYEDITVDGQVTRLVRSDPFATTSFEMVTNLDHTATDTISDTSNPFFAMLGAYDATQSNATTPFGSTMPEYSSSLTVYDELGNDHDLTVYYDPVSTNSLSNSVPGYSYWEYTIAFDADSDASASYNTSAAGLAGMGVLTFNSQGELVQQAAYSLDLTATSNGGKSVGAWVPATLSEDGLPQMEVTFGSNGAAYGTSQTITYDFGLNSNDATWVGSAAGSAANVGTNVDNLLEMSDIDRDARSTTSYDLPSATRYGIQDGYSWGYMENITVDENGYLTGHFSNGQEEQMYQVAVYNFASEWGLRRDGATNFVATDASGAAIVGAPGEEGRGTISQSTLEQSNVDMAEEFAKMILTQRGFQANSKIITTSDSLLNTTISTKR